MLRWYILLSVSLSLIFFYTVLFPKTSVREKEYSVEYLCKFSLDDVISLRLTSPVVEAHFIRDDKMSWRAVSGLSAPNVEESLRVFLRTLIERKFLSVPGSDQDFGVEIPDLSIKLGFVGTGPSWEVHFGDRTPDGFGRFARIGDRRETLILPDYQRENLSYLLIK